MAQGVVAGESGKHQYVGVPVPQVGQCVRSGAHVDQRDLAGLFGIDQQGRGGPGLGAVDSGAGLRIRADEVPAGDGEAEVGVDLPAQCAGVLALATGTVTRVPSLTYFSHEPLVMNSGVADR